MDILPSGNIFKELQTVHETGELSAQLSLEDIWQQVRIKKDFFFDFICFVLLIKMRKKN